MSKTTKNKTYQIFAVATREAEIKASSPEEAIELFMQQNPGYTPEYVDDAVLLGFCDISGKPIFEGDDFKADAEGNLTLNSAEDLEF